MDNSLSPLNKSTLTPTLVLGIDAGGTKTAATIGDAHHVFGHAVVGPGNLHVISEADLIRTLQVAVRRAIQKSTKHIRQHIRQQLGVKRGIPRQHITFQSIVVGMAGIDCATDEQKARRIVHRALAQWAHSHTQWNVVNDVEIVLRSGSQQSYGMAIIAGTGAHGYAINKSGQSAHVSGLGYAIADEGAGYWIGMQALRATARSWDKRGQSTGLERALLKQFKLKTFRDMLPWIRQATKADIARLSIIVEAEALRGDAIAKRILHDALDELVLNVTTLVKTLRMQRTAFDLVVVGGNFTMRDYPFLEEFTKRVKKVTPRAHVTFPNHPPVIGAIRLAQDQL